MTFARMVELQGWRPPLVHMGDGTKVPMPEGSWLVLGVDGRPEVHSDGAFQHRFQKSAFEGGILELKQKRQA